MRALEDVWSVSGRHVLAAFDLSPFPLICDVGGERWPHRWGCVLGLVCSLGSPGEGRRLGRHSGSGRKHPHVSCGLRGSQLLLEPGGPSVVLAPCIRAGRRLSAFRDAAGAQSTQGSTLVLLTETQKALDHGGVHQSRRSWKALSWDI